jgi:hypothetical protein
MKRRFFFANLGPIMVIGQSELKTETIRYLTIRYFLKIVAEPCIHRNIDFNIGGGSKCLVRRQHGA